MRGRKTAMVGAAVAALVAGAAVSGQVGVAAAAAHAPAMAKASDGGLARFETQKITWRSCQTGPKDEVGKALDAAKGQCAEVIVPLDYRRPGGRTITLTMSRTKAGDPARRHGVLMLNPGGPGLSAVELHAGLAAAGSSWSAGYDLIGIDSRGVGRSSPVSCGWNTVTALRSAGPDRRTFGESVAFAKGLAAACARNDRDLLSNLSTRNTARDMDVIRAALGEEKISYFGFSYGTYLGAVYTQLFPQRVDRFVLDSAADPDAAGPDVLRRNGAAGTAALRNWAGWAARRNDTYHLGTTPGQVLATVDQVNRAVARRPLQVGDHQVDSHILPLILFAGLSSDDDAAYAGLAAGVRVFSEAARGAEVTPGAELAGLLAVLSTGTGTAGDNAATLILCADRAASRDPETYWRDIDRHRAAEPLFGPLLRNVSPCSFWPAEPAEPATRIHNTVPLLMVGATGDVNSSYPGQQAMHRALGGSRLATLKGAFRHGAYLSLGASLGVSSDASCVKTAVDRYLLDGVLPRRDLTCTPDVPKDKNTSKKR